VRVNAAIERIEGFSGHAGRDELIEWIEGIGNKPICTFFVHGEADVLDSFSSAVRALGYNVEVPGLLEEITLLPGGVAKAPEAAASPAAAEELAEVRYAQRLRTEVERLRALLDSTDWQADASAALRAEIMEEDVRTLVDKWERILKR
jgi:RNA-metabolizing metallo-beta-lactamase